jgi:hypothetical protein
VTELEIRPLLVDLVLFIHVTLPVFLHPRVELKRVAFANTGGFECFGVGEPQVIGNNFVALKVDDALQQDGVFSITFVIRFLPDADKNRTESFPKAIAC